MGDVNDVTLPINVKKALSLRAPWWWFVFYDGKNIENRSYRTTHRGPIAIHASRWFRPLQVQDDIESAHGEGWLANKGRDRAIANIETMRDCGGHLGLFDCRETLRAA